MARDVSCLSGLYMTRKRLEPKQIVSLYRQKKASRLLRKYKLVMVF